MQVVLWRTEALSFFCDALLALWPTVRGDDPTLTKRFLPNMHPRFNDMDFLRLVMSRQWPHTWRVPPVTTINTYHFKQ